MRENGCAGDDAGTVGFVNENGSAAIGGSLALLESCKTGDFCVIVSIPSESLFHSVKLRVLTSGANEKPLGLSNRVGSFLGSSAITCS